MTIRQLHHSPRRLDIPGSVFFHPVDIALQTIPATLASVFVLGIDPLAAGIVGYISAFYGMFQHWNVRTPRWLGYIIQRPESHGLHHELGIHGRNYSDFPLWDMLMRRSRLRRGRSESHRIDAALSRRERACVGRGLPRRLIRLHGRAAHNGIAAGPPLRDNERCGGRASAVSN